MVSHRLKSKRKEKEIMKIGSLVELVDDNFNSFYNTISIMNGAKKPVKNVAYTVRDIFTIKADCLIRLEEIVNPLDKFIGMEGGYFIKRFRELQPPITNIEEHINLNSLEYENK